MKTLAITAVLAGGLASAVAAPPVRDPDWPCQQIRMPALSLGAVWNGPDLASDAATWSNTQEVADLVREVAQRRLPLADAEAAIRGFAAASGTQRQARLLAVAAGLFATLDAERAQVLAGLDRFGRRQKELAAGVRADMEKLRAQQAATGGEATQEPTNLSERLTWETRIFEQRRQSVAFACDVPNLIEQRLFALLRTIEGLLD